MASVDNKGTPGVPVVVLASQYDPAGNRSSLAATIGGANDFLNSYSYDTLSRLTTMQQVEQSGGNPVASKEIDYGYDAIGDVTTRSAYNFVGVGPRYDMATSAIAYNALGLLTGISMTSDVGQIPLDNLTYSYDTLARVSTFGSIDGTATYGYDPTSQLTSASYVAASGHTEPPNLSMAFDPNGNRSNVNGTVTTISPNNEVTTAGELTYQFDAEGNRTVRTRNSSDYATDYKTTYSWDYRNRLTDVENYDNNGVLTQHVHYVYDVWDHLIERALDPNGNGTYATDTHYVWEASAPPTLSLAGQPPNAPGNIVLAFNGGLQLTTRYVIGPNTSAYDPYLTTLAEEDVNSSGQTAALTFDLQDKQGSLIDVADDSGQLANHVEYSAFGQVFNETNPSVPHLAGYAGGVYDAATQLVYNIERWYDPAATVWISADPSGFRAGDANLFRYAANNSANASDPSGLAPPPNCDGKVKYLIVNIYVDPDIEDAELQITEQLLLANARLENSCIFVDANIYALSRAQRDKATGGDRTFDGRTDTDQLNNVQSALEGGPGVWTVFYLQDLTLASGRQAFANTYRPTKTIVVSAAKCTAHNVQLPLPHEFGHAMGLPHSRKPGNFMTPPTRDPQTQKIIIGDNITPNDTKTMRGSPDLKDKPANTVETTSGN